MANSPTSNPKLSQLHGRFFFELQGSAHRLRKVADKRVIDASGLTTAQAGLLYIVATGAATRQSELAALLAHNESAVTTMVSRLVKSGHLDRRRDPEDARAFKLRVTTEGLASLGKTAAPFKQLDELLDSHFSKAELTILSEWLERLRKLLEAQSDDALMNKAAKN